LFTVATVALAVVASRAATETAVWGDWLLLSACALLMYCADSARPVEESARQLASSSGKPVTKARGDLLHADPNPMILSVFFISLIFIAISVVAYRLEW
jgi:hypothetical protein